jgi:hypothetical protein
MCVLAIHHFDDLRSAMSEAYRVLRSGRFVVFTASPEQMRRYWLNGYFPRAMEKSISQMPATEIIKRESRSAGFRKMTMETYSVEEGLRDFFLYSGKHRPEIYLDPSVRAGISTFASLADEDEIGEGCEKLAKDLSSGEFASVFESYRSGLGDYLFVVMEK